MKLKGTLPKGESDGLSSLEGRIAKKDSEHVAVMMILDVESVERIRHSGEQVVKLGIRRVEAILPDDLEAATQLIRRSYESRTGETTLPIELEDDLKGALAGVSIYEPETPREPEDVRDEPHLDVPPTSEPVEVSFDGVDPDQLAHYRGLTIAALLVELSDRNLDASKGRKDELVARLVAADEADRNGTTPTNVTPLFQDGQQVADEGEGPQTADDYASDVADGRALLGEDGQADAEPVPDVQPVDDEPADPADRFVTEPVVDDAEPAPDFANWERPWDNTTGDEAPEA